MKTFFFELQAVYLHNTISQYIQLSHKCSAGPSLGALFLSLFDKRVEFGVSGAERCDVVGGLIIFALRGVAFICE